MAREVLDSHDGVEKHGRIRQTVVISTTIPNKYRLGKPYLIIY